MTMAHLKPTHAPDIAPLALAGDFDCCRVMCGCGRQLFKLYDPRRTPPRRSTAGQVEIDCPKCQYILWRYVRERDPEVKKKDLIVTRLVDLGAARVIGAYVRQAGAGAPERMDARDLAAALADWHERGAAMARERRAA